MKATAVRAVILCAGCAAACLGGAGAAEIADGVRLAGDLRLRGESHHRGGSFAGEDYSRGRMRVRVGLDVELDEDWDLVFRLATGGGPTSTNQDFDALDGDKAELYVDRAFARFQRDDAPWFELLAGRMPRPYLSTMMLWDSDYNPDGVVERLTLDSDSGKLFLLAGQHVLSLREVGVDPDTDETYGATLFAVQPGVEFKLGEVGVTLAAGYYYFDSVADLSAGVAEDSRDHGIADIYARAKWSTVSGLPFSFWAQALMNDEAEGDRTGAGAGIAVGSAKEPGDLKIGVDYFHVDRNAVWVGLADATLMGGLTDTDMRAVKVGLTVGLGEGTTLAVNWYYKDDRESNADEEIVQIDFVAKF
jgi:hypothetical protein